MRGGILTSLCWSVLIATTPGAFSAAPPRPREVRAELVASLIGGPIEPPCCAFSGDGRTFAVEHGEDRSVVLYETASMKERGRVVPDRAKGEAFRLFTFVSRGRELATAGDFKVEVWDVARCTLLYVIPREDPDSFVRSIAGSQDGSLLAISLSTGVAIWDVQARKYRGKLESGGGYVGQVAFSPDGKTLATASSDDTARLWDLKSFRLRARYPGHEGTASLVAFSPDGRLLATVDQRPYDSKVRVWCVETAALLAVWGGHRPTITGIVFCDHGRTLAAGVGSAEEPGKGGRICLFDVMLKREVGVIDTSPGGLNSLAAVDSSDSVSLVACGPTHAARLFQFPASSPPVPLTASRLPPAAARPAERKDVTLWEELGSTDAKRGYRAVRAFAGRPDTACSILSERVQAAKPVSAGVLEGLIGGLGSDRYEVRARAEKQLEALGEMAVPSLFKVLRHEDLEVRSRARRVLSRINGSLAPEKLREVRAVEVLELIGTEAARAVLQVWAAGAPEARLTREARSALVRLQTAP